MFQSFADSVQVSEITNSRSERKMTAVLMCILFKRSVIASSSVTGRSKEGHPALEPISAFIAEIANMLLRKGT